MTPQTDNIKANVKSYILHQFLPGEDPSELEYDTPLISGGILDSISTVKLVAYLEEQFGVSFEAYEMNADYLDSIDMIAITISDKSNERS